MASNSKGAFLSSTSQEKIETLSHVHRLQVDLEHDARDSKVMIYFTSQQFKHLSEKRCVKNLTLTPQLTLQNPKYSRNNTLLKTIPKNNLE